MSHVSLTAKYRPQTFAQVAGQDTVKAILSRASLEQRVAPAYLFSGTRGVGKTTLARIFAKALNCRTAPTAEPCNVCDQCRAITAGSAVDVVEIDGASNRGIDDVRRLKEVVGYAAMEGGYKIFIIDEAHMLSREAFNALLKTLEEPPARVTFVMATTEPHKFPATIISRCQHYVFKPLSEGGLVEHLTEVLRTEGIPFEAPALRLIARRGSGSVRDSMSLLGQVLALGEGTLTEESARGVLGLAGQESFAALLASLRDGDAVVTSTLLRQLLDQGLDLGFFLRELASLWRNLFMLAQSGEAALGVVDLPENEARRYLEMSADFSLQHIHACWQMTLEGQRRVLTSLEPAQALELLLLNLGMLPRLISLEKLSTASRKAPPRGAGSSGPMGGGPGKAPGTLPGSTPGTTPGNGPGNSLGNHALSGGPGMQPAFSVEQQGTASSVTKIAEPVASVAPEMPAEEPAPPAGRAADSAEYFDGQAVLADEGPPWAEDDEASLLPDTPSEAPPPKSMDTPGELAMEATPSDTPAQDVAGNDPAQNTTDPGQAIPAAGADFDVPLLTEPRVPQHKPDWDDVFPLCQSMESAPWLVSLLKRMNVRWVDDTLLIEAHDNFALERLEEEGIRAQVEQILRAWCGRLPEYSLTAKAVQRKSRNDLKAEVMEHPLVKQVQESFGGYVIDFGQIR